MKLKTKTILFVDDEQIILDIAEFFFKNRGYNLYVANSGRTALNYINEKDKIDIIFLDLMMPEIDGFDILKHLQTVKNNIPIIVQSGILADEDIKRTMQLGATDFISKPYDMKDIEKLVEKHSK